MKTAALLMAAGLVLAGLACPVLAGPRESITFTNVLNDSMRNWIQNEFRECEFQGDYVATKVRISGRIRALVPGQSLLETQIAIGAPDWNIVWVYPFGEMVDEYDTYTLVDSEFDLESPVRASGEWAFQFFDTADDSTGPDAVWETVTITLDDAPPPPDVFYEYLSIDSGDTITTALEARGHGALHEIRGFGAPADADLYRIRITDPASFLAEAQLIRYFGDGANLCLFDTRGKGIVAIDSRTPTTPRLDDSVVTLAPGNYYLGIATSHRYPVDAAGDRLWDETINTQQQPNGPGSLNALHHWEGTGETIQYHIRLTGADYIGPPNTCTADFNHDGDFGTEQDIEAFFRCLAGDCCTDCSSDFNGDGDYGTDQDVEAFFRVLSGAPC